MGASHTTLSVTPEDASSLLLPDYNVDERLYPGSGRMMRTFRLSHKKDLSSLLVAKVMWTTTADEVLLQEQQLELERIHEALRGLSHVAPFFLWKVGNQTQQQPQRAVALLRHYTYTTLSDRLESRPFLTNIEKSFIIHQFLSALQAMHDRRVCHGFLTAQNIGLTSWNHVVILDIASYKSRALLPDDDPTDYLYFYQEEAQQDNSSQREKRCYLAPERFYSPKTSETATSPTLVLTPAMDVFSAGCILLETWLNGERALDLGDLMDYRKQQNIPPSLQQKLSKIESSHLRAACRHMMSLDSSQRLSPKEYLQRLQMPIVFDEIFDPLLESIKEDVPDKRMAVAAAVYSDVLRATLGVFDEEGKAYFMKILGPTFCQMQNLSTNQLEEKEKEHGHKDPTFMESDNLIKETESLLQRLALLDLDDPTQLETPASKSTSPMPSLTNDVTQADATVPASSESLLIFVQIILANIRHVNRPSSKQVALQLISRLSKYSSDETRLQRMIPSAVVLLQDQDPLVRVMAIHTLTTALSQVQAFPPSDSKLFPQYIFKRVSHLLTDASLVVRIAFSQCVAILAETSRRFLDVSHAVRLYEAVGGGGVVSASEKANTSRDPSVFDEGIVRLLDGPTPKEADDDESKEDVIHQSTMAKVYNTLIANTYDSELSGLQEIVSRWVVHITTSEQFSSPKRALLSNLARLCNFFGRDGVLSFILPQILAFLNDRRDWQLRAALFNAIPSACYLIGRAATEHFVLPCLETALVDSEDLVIRSALVCLATLVDMGLLSRSILVNTQSIATKDNISNRIALFAKYCPLLLFPSTGVRYGAITFVNSCCQAFRSPDAEVFLVPILRPYLRFEPSERHLTTFEGLEKCLRPPWTKDRLLMVISECIRDGRSPKGTVMESGADAMMREYVSALARTRANKITRAEETSTLIGSIEGSLKLSQSIKFPSQEVAASLDNSIPTWFSNARDIAQDQASASEYSAFQTVAALNQVYGLSILQGSDEAPTNSPDSNVTESEDATVEVLLDRMRSDVAKQVDAAFVGEWGSESTVDPSMHTMTSLLGKLQALGVPALSPRLGIAFANGPTTETLSKGMGDWRPKIESLISSTTLGTGHLGPVSRLAVSYDQRFFVSASFDSTCKVWELGKIANSSGILESSCTYLRHAETDAARTPRVNDIAIIESSHSVASASSDGQVHVWRVDLAPPRVSQQTTNTAIGGGMTSESPKVVGSAMVRTIDSSREGEVLTVSHFNTMSESLLIFATQRGLVHSWDVRSEKEPFQMKHSAEIGYLTSMALGTDRNWMISGTSKGFVTLWDVRFQRMVKLWYHSEGQPINRLATSYAPIPGSRTGSGPRPLAFVASGGECAMFDLLDGGCRQGFRMLPPLSASDVANPRIALASLKEIDTSDKHLHMRLRRDGPRGLSPSQFSAVPSMNAMVGTMGGYDQNYLITGGSDAQIRFWDFSSPSKCFTISGQVGSQHRPSYERIDYQGSRLLVCRQTTGLRPQDVESSRLPRQLHRGLVRTETRHHDSIMDIKLIQFPIKAIVSCSRDGSVKIFK